MMALFFMQLLESSQRKQRQYWIKRIASVSFVKMFLNDYTPKSVYRVTSLKPGAMSENKRGKLKLVILFNSPGPVC